MGADLYLNFKTLWASLKEELKTIDASACLPELVLICKILHMLPENYDTFKTNWSMFPKEMNTVDNLVMQLCAHDKMQSERNTDRVQQDALLSSKSTGNSNKKCSSVTNIKKTNCNYCGKRGHWFKDC